MSTVRLYFEYDGENEIPEWGVADYCERPHYFELTEYCFEKPRSAVFTLSPVSQQVVQSVLCLAAIWRRWELAYHSGEVSLETHPALPIDHESWKNHLALVETDKKWASGNAFIKVGLFSTAEAYVHKMSSLAGKKWPVAGWYSPDLEVLWSEINA